MKLLVLIRLACEFAHLKAFYKINKLNKLIELYTITHNYVNTFSYKNVIKNFTKTKWLAFRL